jgi:hypothetical protein
MHRSNRTIRRSLLIALIAGFVVPGILPVEAENTPAGEGRKRQDVCDRILPGLNDLLRPDLFLLVGEVHGTRETPEWFGTVVCAAARKGYAVRVGLEIPEVEQPAIEAALEAGSSGEVKEALLRSGFFARDYQDGRSSRAMAELILMMREIRTAGRNLELFSFDPAQNDDRDRKMADRILAVRKKEPQAAIFVLTGNIHASQAKGTRWNPDLLPTGYHLAATGAAPVSLKAVTSGGSAWICQSMEAKDCGPVGIGGQDLGNDPFLSLDKEKAPAGYDGILYIGEVQASPPLIGPAGE